ncbi:asparagine synthase-related protein [Pedomonas mirosovicensis]|uniref:asparagine synthase-related protein n=1 Tax=Pedomonas mirosovicensis TaxID=2908641 RepID=UPI0021695B14|nr:asparagine synthase-related protein [Pedomonas mirosovicensis]MCH8686698.1 asparagine synthase-related protein [Pedomonas mirosovicensis]
MFGLIAIYKNGRDTASRTGAVIENIIRDKLPFYVKCLDNDNLIVYTFTSVPEFFQIIRVGSSGIIAGKIFKKKDRVSNSLRQETFTDLSVEEIMQSDGKALISNYWGHYIAVCLNEASGNGFALHSPLGGIPLYYTNICDCKVFFSRPVDMASMELSKWQIDWDYLKFHERYYFLDTEDSGFQEVRKILHGRRLKFSIDHEELENLWPLSDLCKPIDYGSPYEQARIFRDTLVDCVGAWASCFDRVCLRLSGGLDSSVVASAIWLSGVATDVICYNFYGPTAEGDEREYARAVTEKLGYKLIEIADKPANQRYDLLPKFPLSAKPLDEIISAFRGPTEFPILESTNSKVVFSGMPGDAIFFQGNVNFATDYLIDRGFDLGFIRAARWAARRTKQSIWAIVFDALHYRFNNNDDIVRDKLGMSEAPCCLMKISRRPMRIIGYLI